jgi:aspartate racemase
MRGRVTMSQSRNLPASQTNDRRSFGVIGGMGPASTLRFLQSIINRYRVHLGAIRNCDFPQITLYTIPSAEHMDSVPSPEVVPHLRRALKLLSFAGTHFVVAPCNTVHQFLPLLEKKPSMGFLSIVSVVSKVKVPALTGRHVLLLSTRQTRFTGLYAEVFHRKRWKPVFLTESDQDMLDTVILRANAGGVAANLRTTLTNIVKSYPTEGVLLGCTELSLLLPINVDRCVVDSLEELADATYLVSSAQRDIAYYSMS